MPFWGHHPRPPSRLSSVLTVMVALHFTPMRQRVTLPNADYGTLGRYTGSMPPNDPQKCVDLKLLKYIKKHGNNTPGVKAP